MLDDRVREGNRMTECDDFDWILGVTYSGGTEIIHCTKFGGIIDWTKANLLVGL